MSTAQRPHTKAWGLLIGASMALLATAASAAPPPSWSCVRGDDAVCRQSELARPAEYRQILVLPAGYAPARRQAFFDDAERLRKGVSDLPKPSVFTTEQRSRLLYVTLWLDGGPLGSDAALFGARTYLDPQGGETLTLDPAEVIATVAQLRGAALAKLSPLVVVVLFDVEGPADGHPTIPSYSRGAFGVIPMAGGQAQDSHVVIHELGHAALSFVDEYVENGFEQQDINALDTLTPLVHWTGQLGDLAVTSGSFLSTYDLRVSEIVGDNGADNLSTRRLPGTVQSPRAPGSEAYEHEGGMFFGKGTFHDAGVSIMGRDDSFAYAHTDSQWRIVDTAFGGKGAGRANDRLRSAGPPDGWSLPSDNDVTLVMFDADKNHHWHPTQRYDVQVGWWERAPKPCPRTGTEAPCFELVWTVLDQTVAPTADMAELALVDSSVLEPVLRRVACGLGLGYAKGGVDLCELTAAGVASPFLPTLRFYTPYQAAQVPVSQSFTTYWWRFRTANGTYQSGWTGWSSFYRSF
jgi:hypothetical protein